MLLEKTQKKKRKERNDIEPSFNIRYEFANLKIWKVSLPYHRIIDLRYCLFPNARTRWHIEKRELQVFEGLFWSGPKRSGTVACSVCRFVCHGASRLPLMWKVFVRTRESSYLGHEPSCEFTR